MANSNYLVLRSEKQTAEDETSFNKDISYPDNIDKAILLICI